MLYKKFIYALKGRKEWLHLKKLYDIDADTLILFMPDCNEKINYYAIKHLESFMKKKYLNKSVIFTNQEYVKEVYRQILTPNSKMVYIEDELCKKIQCYYRLQWFHVNFYMISVFAPDGNTVGNMLKSTKLTEEELLLSSIYI